MDKKETEQTVEIAIIKVAEHYDGDSYAYIAQSITQWDKVTEQELKDIHHYIGKLSNPYERGFYQVVQRQHFIEKDFIKSVADAKAKAEKWKQEEEKRKQEVTKKKAEKQLKKQAKTIEQEQALLRDLFNKHGKDFLGIDPKSSKG
jgi:hypothetical protein